MAFRDDREALRNLLEDTTQELAQAREDLERLRDAEEHVAEMEAREGALEREIERLRIKAGERPLPPERRAMRVIGLTLAALFVSAAVGALALTAYRPVLEVQVVKQEAPAAPAKITPLSLDPTAWEANQKQR